MQRATEKPGDAWPWRRIAMWTVLLVLALSWRGKGFIDSVRPQVVYIAGEPRIPIIDFFQEWSSCRFYLDGLPVYGSQDKALFRYLGNARGPDQLFNEVNAHPPTAILIALPLARLDYLDACFVWNLVSLAAFAVSIWIILRQLDLHFSPWALLPFVTLMLPCGPFYEQVAYAQFNLILLLLIVGAWAADRAGRPGWGGFLLGTAAVIKLFPGFLFVYFLMQRRWLALVMGCAAVLFWTGLTAAVLGPASYLDYFRQVVPHVNGAYLNYWPNLSLPGYWHKLFDGSGTAAHTVSLWQSTAAARVASVVSCLVVVAIVAAVMFQARSLPQRDGAFALGVTAMLLVSPITWSHYLLLLFLPVVLIWINPPNGRAGRIVLWLCLGAIWLKGGFLWSMATGMKVETWTKFPAQPLQTLTWLSLHTYALVCLFVLGVLVSKEKKGEPAASAAG